MAFSIYFIFARKSNPLLDYPKSQLNPPKFLGTIHRFFLQMIPFDFVGKEC